MEPNAWFECSSDSVSSNWPIKNEGTGVVIKTQAVALGLGSLFNHSTLNPNVGWERNLDAQCITYRALRGIRAGEELCINYGVVVSHLLDKISFHQCHHC